MVRWNLPNGLRLLSTQRAATLISGKNVAKVVQDDIKPIGWDEALPFDKIPGPKSIPLIGNVWRFLPKIGDLHGIQPHDMQYRFYKQYGDIACLKGIFNRKPMVMVFSPEEIEKVYRNEGPWPVRNFIFATKYYKKQLRRDLFGGASGLGAENGEAWSKFRSIVNPIFLQPKVVKQYVNKIDGVANELIEHIRFLSRNDPKQEMPENFGDELYKYAFESVGLIALDKRLGNFRLLDYYMIILPSSYFSGKAIIQKYQKLCGAGIGCLNRDSKENSDAQLLINLTKELFQLCYRLDILPSLWKWYSTPDWKRLVFVLDTIVSKLMTYIEEESTRLEKQGFPSKDLSVFQKLIQIDKKIAFLMTLEMLVAGVDTTGKVISAGLYYLATNNESQQKLRQELINIMPSKNSPVTSKVLEEAHYLKAVIKEITRLATVGISTVRTTVKDMVLSGYQIPEGTDILMCHLCISTRTDKYFPKAESFIPERWLRNVDNELSAKSISPFVSLPFGFGPRSCIGQRFATMEMEVVLAKILRNFELAWHQPKMKFETTLLYGIASPLKLQVKEIAE